MRGKVDLSQVITAHARITPAYAGKSEINRLSKAGIEDHPCVCGEKGLTVDGADRYVGSPLRMRGKVEGFSISRSAPRITPAYAGKS